MARKEESGIEYFPMNSDIITNPKVKLLVAEFGSRTTWTVLLTLYCKIYREKGYWIDWYDDDSKMLFAQYECKLELSIVNEFVNGCLRRSLFDKRVFDMFGVLTSDRIQENYLTAKKRSKQARFIEEFCVLEDDVYKSFLNVYKVDFNVDTVKKKVNISTQKKKEKEKLKGEGDSGEPPPVYSEADLLSFKNFEEFITKNAPRVKQLTKPFTIDEFLKVRESYEAPIIKTLLKKMDNWKPLTKNNVSAYQTFLNWAKNSHEKADSFLAAVPNDINERLKAAQKTA